MADALADLVINNPDLLINGSVPEIHKSMKAIMRAYYHPDQEIKKRPDIQLANRIKRWNSGRNLIQNLVIEVNRETSYEL